MNKIRIRIPTPWDGWEAKLHLREWMDNKKTRWPEDRHFYTIDKAREMWEAQGFEDLADDPASIVSTTWSVFLCDEDMRNYVLNVRNQDITDGESWQKVAETYAYVILQRYNRKLDTK